jgi:selenocysteine lyase/cysteine desulfurase
VTGIVTDVDAVAAALRRHGALACFDYAAAGPYLPIDMTGKDAVFLSPHKFAGGPGSPGVLVAKRALFGSGPPTVPSGGTILFVSPTEQSYHPDPSVREEGGTPAIVESIRAGMVFELKEEAGAAEIARRGRGLARRALASWGANPNIEILGDPHADRLLHGNFVVAVLSDLFGIQARSGCFCAGLYLHRMYPIDDPWSAAMHEEVARGHLGAKLAFTRISFGYFASEAAIGYIVDAVHLVADEGWKLLPYYRFDPASGLWEHEQGGARFSGATAPETVLAVQLEDARGILAGLDPAPPVDPPVTEEFERVRWFPLPSGEAALPSLPPR